jgi:hypothetical protein
MIITINIFLYMYLLCGTVWSDKNNYRGGGEERFVLKTSETCRELGIRLLLSHVSRYIIGGLTQFALNNPGNPSS